MRATMLGMAPLRKLSERFLCKTPFKPITYEKSHAYSKRRSVHRVSVVGMLPINELLLSSLKSSNQFVQHIKIDIHSHIVRTRQLSQLAWYLTIKLITVQVSAAKL
jgi:hypothetical protein